MPTVAPLPQTEPEAQSRPIKVKVPTSRGDEPVPQGSENFDAEPVEAPDSRVEQVRSAQSKLEQRRRSASEGLEKAVIKETW